jgi:hypothetical protein
MPAPKHNGLALKAKPRKHRVERPTHRYHMPQARLM